MKLNHFHNQIYFHNMKTIYKYPLEPGTNKLQLPDKAQVLHAASVNGEPVIYAIVDPDEKKMSEAIFHVYGTGPQPFHASMPEPDAIGFTMCYIGTVNCEGLVWHVFVEFPAEPTITAVEA